MEIKNEFLYDFAVNMPRVMISGSTGIIDNVKKILLASEQQIIIYTGLRFTAITGKNLVIKQLEDERMMVTGEIEKIEFYGAQEKA